MRLAMTMEEIETSVKEIWTLFKETDARLDKRIKETDARLDKRFRETDKKIKELSKLFTTQWGKLIESLAESGILEIMQARGIKVSKLARRLEGQENGRHIEVDFLLNNEHELVVGEVKTTMGIDDVKHFLKKLKDFLSFFPYFKGFKIYGAMVGIRIEEEADRYAYRQGLFVFKVGGEGMLKILNDLKFKPKDFSSVAKKNL
jgi:hypothetical protein